MIGKPLAAFAITWLMRYPFATSLSVAVALAQIGEFSFMLSRVGRDLGVLAEEAVMSSSPSRSCRSCSIRSSTASSSRGPVDAGTSAVSARRRSVGYVLIDPTSASSCRRRASCRRRGLWTDWTHGDAPAS